MVLPPVEIPGFAGGEVHPGDYADDPAAAATELRQRWRLGDAPIPRIVRTMERNGIVVTLVPFAGAATKTGLPKIMSTRPAESAV